MSNSSLPSSSASSAAAAVCPRASLCFLIYRIRDFYERYALYKFTFYLLTYLLTTGSPVNTSCIFDAYQSQTLGRLRVIILFNLKKNFK